MLTQTLIILRLRDVKARTGLSRSTIYLRMSEDLFPKPISLGGLSVGWIEAEVSEWIAHKVPTSRQGQQR